MLVFGCVQGFLLTEIVRKAVPPSYLFGIIKENRINPNWMDIPLPPGMMAPMKELMQTVACLGSLFLWTKRLKRKRQGRRIWVTFADALLFLIH
jgi:hypothetical protein